MKKDTIIQSILLFLKDIGINIIEQELPDTTFLPGLALSNKGICIDFTKLLYPGDILHEAGHLAVTPSTDRKHIDTTAMPKDWPTQGDEIGAMLWSYAACKHLSIPIEVVFHPNGYKGNSEWLMNSYKDNTFIGLPYLEWCGLTLSIENAEKQNTKPFPHMIKWIRD